MLAKMHENAFCILYTFEAAVLLKFDKRVLPSENAAKSCKEIINKFSSIVLASIFLHIVEICESDYVHDRL